MLTLLVLTVTVAFATTRVCADEPLTLQEGPLADRPPVEVLMGSLRTHMARRCMIKQYAPPAIEELPAGAGTCLPVPQKLPE
jgi:hypothetical protein